MPVYKPILLKKPHQIYDGLMTKFKPGELVHLKLSFADKKAIPLNKDRGWVIGLGLDLQEVHPKWNEVIESLYGFTKRSTHVLFVLCMNDILAVHFSLQKNQGKQTLILKGEKWRGIRDTYQRASWCLLGPGVTVAENLVEETCL